MAISKKLLGNIKVEGSLDMSGSTLTGLGALSVDDVAVDGKVITITGDTSDPITLTGAANGEFTLQSVDAAGAAAHINVLADGNIQLDAEGNIELDAKGGTISFQDEGSSLGTITSSGYSGNAATASALASARTIGGVSFDGSANINLPGVNAAGNQDTTGTAAIATTVTVADESSDTTCFPLFATAATGDLGPKSGSNLTFNSSTGMLTATGFTGPLTGLASTATKWAASINIGGVAVDGSTSVNLPGVNAAGNQDTSGTAAVATAVTAVDAAETDATYYVTMVDGLSGSQGIETESTLTYNPSSGVLTTTTFTGALSGNAATATKFAASKTIAGVAFDGSANIAIPAAGLSDVTDAGSGIIISGAERTKLSGIETSADVTDKANVMAALASMDDGDTLYLGDAGDDATVVVRGTLQVDGTTTTINSTTVNLDDHNIVLDKGNSTSAAVDGAGITIEGGSGDDVTFNWVAASDRFDIKKGSSYAGLKAGTFTGALTGDVTGNCSGTAATVTGAAQSAITSVGTLTALQVDNININGNQVVASSGALSLQPAAGSAIVLDSTINVDAGVVTGATSITSTAFVGALTGNADTATALANARTIGGVSFDGSANINLPGVNASGNQDTSGNAATATALETGRTIGMTGDVVWTSASFTGAGNVTGSAVIQDDAVHADMLNDDLMSGQDNALTSGLAATDEILVSDGGSLKRMDISVLNPLLFNAGDAAALGLEVGADLSVAMGAGGGSLKYRRHSAMFQMRVDFTAGSEARAHLYAQQASDSGSGYPFDNAGLFGKLCKDTGTSQYFGGSDAAVTLASGNISDLSKFRTLAAESADSDQVYNAPATGGGHKAHLILYSNANYTGELAVFEAQQKLVNDGSGNIAMQWTRGAGTSAVLKTDGTANTTDLDATAVKSWSIVEGGVICHKTNKVARVDYDATTESMKLHIADWLDGDTTSKVDWHSRVFVSTDVNGAETIGELDEVVVATRGKFDNTKDASIKYEAHVDLDGYDSDKGSQVNSGSNAAHTFFVHLQR